MLRITTPNPDDKPAVFVLEGKLTGACANELLRVTLHIDLHSDCVLDLQSVSFVDPFGEEALCWLNRLGARFTTDTFYGKDLCRRLNLRRVGCTRVKTETERQKKVSPLPLHNLGSRR